MRQITVSQDGQGDYRSIGDAIEAVRVLPLEPVTIYVKNGIYREKLVVPDNKPDITLIGESAEGTVIAWGDYAKMTDERGREIATFRTATLKVEADDFRMENLTVQNTAGYGPEIGQAVALYTAGDRQVYRRVRLIGHQDTLYTSRGRQYFEDCYIEGHVDYIFGSATVFFESCEIHSLRAGYVTAASTAERTELGYVFRGCRLTGAAEEASVYLGRPWRPAAHTVFIDTWMGPHIHPAGWDNWSNPDNERTSRYGEYGSTGPGAAPAARVPWAAALPEAQARALDVQRVLGGHDGWNPAAAQESRQ
ncbi:Pectinesterase [Paenibacillus mucilaginosus 3016]|uniref:Pectinesterase n=2 Tax=Paenibacillus mucilaginosus TaxID=61624 RepID=H6NND2_9BACL|nr:pectinesterase family protein [Paenibacillus mucilaginosus]AFC32511.1 Pectinesterase [Paenibacillus mucilaginosus 3016]AFH64830.1 pectinesterase [Paenibacillus mucilaginosus K02]WFA20989.1 pectin esterase [Paenibacillus mucilaginosus]